MIAGAPCFSQTLSAGQGLFVNATGMRAIAAPILDNLPRPDTVPVNTQQLFSETAMWGRQDWDQFTFRYEAPRIALLRDHAMPAWHSSLGPIVARLTA